MRRRRRSWWLSTAITITTTIITTIPVSTSDRLKALPFHPCRKFFIEKARQGWSPALVAHPKPAKKRAFSAKMRSYQPKNGQNSRFPVTYQLMGKNYKILN
jgi:hypothetical protein